MSCAGKGYGTKYSSNDYLYSQFYTNSNYYLTKNTSKCKKNINSGYPIFNPVLISLSVNNSKMGVYSFVYISGFNFLPNGITFVKFGNLGYLPVTYYSSFQLSFIVPGNTTVGNYKVQIVNLYNNNFSPPVNQSYPGILNFSSPINYTIY